MSDLDLVKQFLPWHFARVSAKQLGKVRQSFGSLEQALLANRSDMKGRALMTDKQLERLFDKDITPQIEDALHWFEGQNQTIITLESCDYPLLLKEIPDPPILLYVRGQTSLLKDPQLAIVGSRHASKQGQKTAEDFAQYLANMGLTITSGLASGIDRAAHEGALRASVSNGTTVAVVATGLDRVYPASNRDLARQVAEQGVMISEYPLGTQPMAHFFPQRNRIISGLSLGVLVVEAALKSGSLITARTALEQGREVFAVPGSIHNPQAKGCHQLLKQGAKLVESGQDILEELKAELSGVLATEKENKQDTFALTKEDAHSKLLSLIEYEPMGLDELVVLSKLPVSEIQAELVMLELSGEIEAMSAGRWRRIR